MDGLIPIRQKRLMFPSLGNQPYDDTADPTGLRLTPQMDYTPDQTIVNPLEVVGRVNGIAAPPKMEELRAMPQRNLASERKRGLIGTALSGLLGLLTAGGLGGAAAAGGYASGYGQARDQDFERKRQEAGDYNTNLVNTYNSQRQNWSDNADAFKLGLKDRELENDKTAQRQKLILDILEKAPGMDENTQRQMFSINGLDPSVIPPGGFKKALTPLSPLEVQKYDTGLGDRMYNRPIPEQAGAVDQRNKDLAPYGVAPMTVPGSLQGMRTTNRFDLQGPVNPDAPLPASARMLPTGGVRVVEPDPTGQSLGSELTQYPVRAPGLSLSPEGQSSVASTAKILQDMTIAPVRLQMDIQKMIQEGKIEQAKLLMDKWKTENGFALDAKRIDNQFTLGMNGLGVTMRGQDKTEATAGANRAATATTSGNNLAFNRRKAAMDQITPMVTKRDELKQQMRGIDAMLASGVEAKKDNNGNEISLTDNQRMVYQSMREGLASQARGLTAQIGQIKAAAGIGVEQPRDNSGRYTKPGQKVKAPSGRTYEIVR